MNLLLILVKISVFANHGAFCHKITRSAKIIVHSERIMKFEVTPLLVIVVLGANISATSIIAGNQMSAFGQREVNIANVTSDRIQEQTQLNTDMRSQIDSNNREDRSDNSQPDIQPDLNTQPDNTATQTDTNTQDTTQPSTQPDNSVIPNTEVGSSNPNEVGSANANEVGSNEVGVAAEPDERVERAEIYKQLVENIAGEAADELKEKALEAGAKYADDALAASQNPVLRAAGKAAWTSTVNELTSQFGASVEIVKVGAALRTVQVCNANNPNCPTPPPPTQEPAACDPQVAGDCLKLDKAPCTPAAVVDAKCTSGGLECTQTLLEHDIFCTAKFPDGGFVNIVYFTPPGLDPQIVETRCTPNPTPPPFNDCVVTSK
jgi:hypothetical protein